MNLAELMNSLWLWIILFYNFNSLYLCMDLTILTVCTVLSLMPAYAYILILYTILPYGVIKFSKTIQYIFGGILSVLILSFIFLNLPGWVMSENNHFYNDFLVTATKEELSKLIAFVILSYLISGKNHPLSTMISFGILGLGFSIFENIQYGLSYGPYIIPIRAVTSTIAHIISGFIFGYWIGLSKLKKPVPNGKSVFSILVNKNKKFKIFMFTLIGFVTSVTYHGLWNFNLSTSGDTYKTIALILLFMGLLISVLCFKDLSYKHKKQ